MNTPRLGDGRGAPDLRVPLGAAGAPDGGEPQAGACCCVRCLVWCGSDRFGLSVSTRPGADRRSTSIHYSNKPTTSTSTPPKKTNKQQNQPPQTTSTASNPTHPQKTPNKQELTRLLGAALSDTLDGSANKPLWLCNRLSVIFRAIPEKVRVGLFVFLNK